MSDFSKEDADQIRASSLFDRRWYMRAYPDVKLLGMDPIEHYLRIGAAVGRNPSRSFNTKQYLNAHKELLESGGNPLLHHVREQQDTRAIGDQATSALRTSGVTHSMRATADSSAVLPPLPATAVVIPVYNAPAETAKCIESVIACTDPSERLLIVDDDSPDPLVDNILTGLLGLANIMVVRNARNMGYTRTVNRGIDLAGRSDVVLLNSDTRVTPLWLRNLRLAAYSGDRIATATPFSNNAGAFSAPLVNEDNPRPKFMSYDNYARSVTRVSERLYPRTPTGSGFCMYIRRACIDEVGAFDAEAFPRGYGEENDFCMRASQLGWSHVIDDATLIYHVRSASFGVERKILIRSGRSVVDQRYPDYTRAVRSFLADPVVHRARENVRKASVRRRGALRVRPRVLFVISTSTGGTPQTNNDLVGALGDRYDSYILRCDAKNIEFTHAAKGMRQMERMTKLQDPIRPFPHVSAEYDTFLRALLVDYAIELVHIRHIGWHSLNLPAVCQSLGVPVVFSFHDYYCVCPTIKLLDERLNYCGGVCTSTKGNCRPELWRASDLPHLKDNAVHDWKKMMQTMLSFCDAFVTTSQCTFDQIISSYGDLRSRPFHVIPHGRDMKFKAPARFRRSNGRRRILVPGNISIPKGALLIEELADLDRGRRFVFHILGKTILNGQRGIVVHGEYSRDDFAAVVSTIDPHLGMILSIWPETHCHTLTELWACGLPVVGLDFGAVGERIRAHGGGWLLRHGDGKRLYERLLELEDDEATYNKHVRSIAAWQRGPGRQQDTAWMANQYAEVYRQVMSERRSLRLITTRV